jgi:DNA-binding CsgD family transcriptional regulator
LHRLGGEFQQAEEAYWLASRWSGEPQPGLALLRLAQGRRDVAVAGIRRAIDIAEDGPARARLLPAYVDIMVAAGDVPAARRGADELRTIAEDVDTPWLQASAEQALGTVLLAEGDGSSALRVLRRAWTTWSTLDVPYDGARTRVVMGLACRSLGDEDGAAMEFDAAKWIFQQLGALPDVARAEDLARHTITAPAGGLTRRELEVLRQLASGKSNRAIATELFLSEKTVARHVSNIFTKLGLSSRSAATRYAYEHGLIQPI